jgi:hypothetical protein
MFEVDGSMGYRDVMGGNRNSNRAGCRVPGATASKKPCETIVDGRKRHGLYQAACLAVASAKAGGTQNNSIPATRQIQSHIPGGANVPVVEVRP